jgi:lipopolysaccharide export system protein LptA
MYQTAVNHFFLLFLLLSSCICFALPNDAQQVVRFRADSVDINQSTNLGKYIGNVQLDQGTTHVRAAEACTESNQKNQLTKVTIKGNAQMQAHYWTLPTQDKPVVHAYADIIYYYPEKHIIELVGHAKVRQAKNSFSAPKIEYNTLEQHVVSNSAGQSTRTTIILHPEPAS